MPTSKPLKDMLPEIRTHITNHVQYLEYNNRLFLVNEGQLRKEVEDSMRQELSPTAFAKAIRRVPSINLLVRMIDKLSRVYSEPVKRDTASGSDKELLAYYEHTANVDARMASANRMYNLQKCVAIEPYLCNGEPALRVLPAHQFLVYSDDPENPTEPTVFIKFMGEARAYPFVSRDGVKTVTNEVIEFVQTYYLYSDDEFLIMDSQGILRDDLMAEYGAYGYNPYGVIPFLYINRSEFRLLPVPDNDTLGNTILVPKLLADLNYAVQFQSHSIFTAIDLDMPTDMTHNPDVVWPLTTRADSPQAGRLDVVRPVVDIAGVLELIVCTVSMWLESRNIKPGDMGHKQVGDAASGVARMVDEADATQDRQEQALRFAEAERGLWSLIGTMHNYWVKAKLLTEQTQTFSEDLEVSTVFGDQRPIVSEKDTLDTVVAQMGAGLMSRRQALRKLYPDFTDDAVEAWIKELDSDGRQLQGANGQDPGSPQGPQGAPPDGGVPGGSDPGAGKGTGARGVQPGSAYEPPGATKP